MSTREILQNGATANDGTGDTLRDAADKINTNFLSLWELLGSQQSLTGYVQFDSDGNLVFSNANTVHSTTLTATDATAARTVTIPDATGTLSLIEAEETLENKTLLHPIADDIHDSDDNEILGFNGNPTNFSNYLEVTNGDSAAPVELRVAGAAGDVDIKITAGGAGALTVENRVVLGSETISADGITADLEKVTSILNKGGLPFGVTLANGQNVGDVKRFLNINSATCTITPASLAGGTTIELAQNGACTLIWSGTSWHLEGNAVTIA